MGNKVILVWFRNDLRIHDNEILLRAVERNNQIIPVYCFDPRYFTTTKLDTRKTGVLRASFIRENVIALRQQLQKLGGDLIVEMGYPEEILPRLATAHHIDEVYHHREVAQEETHISALVEEALWKMQINLRHFIGHTLYHKEDLPFPIKDIPDEFSVFKKKVERETSIRPQLPTPSHIAVPDDVEPGEIPTLEDLGYTEEEIAFSSNLTFGGGEEIALAQMNHFLAQPDFYLSDAQLSPYIAIGALSPNTFYHALIEHAEGKVTKKLLEKYLSKLLWRDYFRFMFKKHGNKFFQSGGLLTDPDRQSASTSAEAFERWKTGNTGVPVIDNAMRQLNQTGYVPESGRVLLAAYLVQVLRVNWLLGAAWFEEKLIDYNPANNYGNWAHTAGVGSSKKENKPIDIDKSIR